VWSVTACRIRIRETEGSKVAHMMIIAVEKTGETHSMSHHEPDNDS
jgi:hypothetical protein